MAIRDRLKEVKEKIKSYGLNREGIRDLKKWFLNDIMNEEAKEQINASRHPGMRGMLTGRATGIVLRKGQC